MGFLEFLIPKIISLLNSTRQKDTSPAYDADTDSLEAISEAVASLGGVNYGAVASHVVNLDGIG